MFKFNELYKLVTSSVLTWFSACLGFVVMTRQMYINFSKLLKKKCPITGMGHFFYGTCIYTTKNELRKNPCGFFEQTQSRKEPNTALAPFVLAKR